MNDKDSSSFNQNKPPNHAVIILASGLSHRLGQPKQLLEKQGKPLINYMTMLALVTQLLLSSFLSKIQLLLTLSKRLLTFDSAPLRQSLVTLIHSE